MRIFIYCLIVFLATNANCDESEEEKYWHLNTGMYKDAESGKMEGVRYCIKFQADRQFAYNKMENNTALHAAVIKGHEDIVSMLILNGWNVNARNDKLMTPLHYAAAEGLEGIVISLIRKGADVDAKDTNQYTPLITAAIKGHIRVVDTMIHFGANITASDIEKSPKNFLDLISRIAKEQETAHLKFVENGKLSEKLIENELLKNGSVAEPKYAFWLIRNYKPNTNITNEEGNTPLHNAALNGHFEFSRLLIMTGVNVNAANKEGETPLHYAAKNGHEKVVELLLRKGAKFNAKITKSENTPLHLAAQNGHWASVYLLLLHGTDSNTQNYNGLTPLHYAADEISKLGYGNHSSYSNYKRVIEILLQSNADRHITGDNGVSPMDNVRDEGIMKMFREIRSVAKKECGKNLEMIFDKNSTSRNRRAANGVRATPAEFPWMAAVGKYSNTDDFGFIPVFSCGGTIVSDSFVLTAAHCVTDSDQMVVRVGTKFIKKGEPTKGQDYDVEKVLRPNFLVELINGSFVRCENDIALLKLKERIKFSSFVSPACLNLERREENHGLKLVLSGWGATENKTSSEHLLKVSLFTMPGSECTKWYPNRRIVESQYCAYNPESKGDACRGDSGGPLQFFHPSSSLATVVGVVSYGSSCPSDSADVYTKVSYYLDWIQSHVWPNETAMKYFADKNVNDLDSGVYSATATVYRKTKAGGKYYDVGMITFLEKTYISDF